MAQINLKKNMTDIVDTLQVYCVNYDNDKKNRRPNIIQLSDCRKQRAH